MDNKIKSKIIPIAFGVVLFAILMNFSVVMKFLNNVSDVFMPIITGFIIAFILNVPMRGFEKLLKKLTSKSKRPQSAEFISAISLALTLIAVILVAVLAFTLIIPALISSIVSLYEIIIQKWSEWSNLLKEYEFIDTAKITEWLNSVNVKSILEKLSAYAGSIITSTAGIISTVFGTLANFGISVVIAIYVLLSKKTLARQAKKVINAYAKENVANHIFHVCKLIDKAYSKFLSGQCIESCILALLMFVVFSIFRIPYGGLTGLLAGIFAFIPYIGAFAACAVGAFLVLIAEPSKFILCIIVYLVVQYIENQYIYPHVVGSSVGLSAMWTLIAVLIGGNLFGVFGMIFFIPLMSVILTLFKEATQRRIDKKNEIYKSTNP